MKKSALWLPFLLVSTISAHGADSTSGVLDGSSPTYNRIFSGDVDPDCNATSTFSGTGVGVSYASYAFYSPAGEVADIEVTSFTGGDTVLSIYCEFDPLDASLNLVAYDDDGGSGLLSAITPADNVILQPNTTYYLVFSTFSPGNPGTFEISLGGDLLFGSASLSAPESIPFMGNWGLIFLSVLVGLAGLSYSRHVRVVS